MIQRLLFVLTILFLSACTQGTNDERPATVAWQTDFFDDFDAFNPENWQDQLLWVNNEDQCYVRNGEFGTREVSGGTLKLRVVDLGEARPCDNQDKEGNRHHDTRYVAGRIASKNRKEFMRGRWTARLRVPASGQDGMFPAWWLLGARNNEPPVQESNENICWPMTGSGEIDIFEHHSDGGPDHYAARIIDSFGHCEGGDWQSHQKVLAADLADYHEYSVEWRGNDLVFGLDGVEAHRVVDRAADFPEPFFAILNFAKISDVSMQRQWIMEVDWVRHEYNIQEAAE